MIRGLLWGSKSTIGRADIDVRGIDQQRAVLRQATASWWLAAHPTRSSSLTSPSSIDNLCPERAPMNLHDATIPIFTRLLSNIEKWLDKAAAYADTKKFDVDVLARARLAPDQYDLVRQIQATCDQIKYTVAKLTGKEPPAHPDTEKTIAELRQRLRTVAAYLATFTPEDFHGAEERSCSHSWMGGRSVRGGDYLDEFALPNMYFHATTAYAILRHNGVPLGKMDYITTLTFRS
jgi:uncharacterized protein